jgi:hypothetical protein
VAQLTEYAITNSSSCLLLYVPPLTNALQS